MFKYTALIVEPRKHPALEFVLHNFCSNLSDEWGIMVFHGTENYDYLIDIIENKLAHYKNRFIRLINLGVSNLPFYDYNNLCFQTSFYESIPTETFLIFQTDALINSSCKDLINKFIDCDYVGAPWSSGMVGNGGLSLRKKSKVLHILKTIQRYGHEDSYFSDSFKKLNYNVPSFEEAKTFAIETVYNSVFFGVHAPWKHLKHEDLDKIITICPDIKILMELNKNVIQVI